MRTLPKPYCLALLVLFIMPVAGNAKVDAEKIKVLVVTGFDVDPHKWQESTKLVQAILEE